MGDESLSLVLFSGTSDKLSAAATLAAGAAALGKPVNVFLQYWALAAFRSDRDGGSTTFAPDAADDASQARAWANEHGAHFIDVFEQAKAIGDVSIHACAQSMEMFGLTKDDLSSLVDDIEGVAAFWLDANGQVLFI